MPKGKSLTLLGGTQFRYMCPHCKRSFNASASSKIVRLHHRKTHGNAPCDNHGGTFMTDGVTQEQVEDLNKFLAQ